MMKFVLIGWKTFGEKEKMLVTSVFSFSHDVFKRFLPNGSYKSGLCGKEIKYYLILEVERCARVLY